MSLPSIPDYSNAIKTPALIHAPILQGGKPVEKGVHLIKYSGGFSVVYPYQTPTNKYAVRCWHAEVGNIKERTKKISEALRATPLPYFVRFDYYDKGIVTPQGMQPIVVMDWVDAKSLKKYLSENYKNHDTMLKLANDFKEMVSALHKYHFSHGDLQHGNIMVRGDGSLVLVDYDSMYVPSLKGMTDEVKGLAGYQHEARWQNKYMTEKADYFSELVIYTSILALSRYPNLWTELAMEDTETLLFSAEDIQSKGHSQIFDTLRRDNELEPLANKLCEYLKMNSIDTFEPLEKAIITQDSAISSKWKSGNGYIAKQAEPTTMDDSKTISKKWSAGNGYKETKTTPVEDSMVNNITSRFKRPE